MKVKAKWTKYEGLWCPKFCVWVSQGNRWICDRWRRISKENYEIMRQEGYCVRKNGRVTTRRTKP